MGRHLGRGLEVALLGLFDEGIDHIGLASFLDLALDEPVCLRLLLSK